MVLGTGPAISCMAGLGFLVFLSRSWRPMTSTSACWGSGRPTVFSYGRPFPCAVEKRKWNCLPTDGDELCCRWFFFQVGIKSTKPGVQALDAFPRIATGVCVRVFFSNSRINHQRFLNAPHPLRTNAGVLSPFRRSRGAEKRRSTKPSSRPKKSPLIFGGQWFEMGTSSLVIYRFDAAFLACSGSAQNNNERDRRSFRNNSARNLSKNQTSNPE